MKRILSMVLVGASFLIPSSADAQRGRVDHARVLRANTARLAACRAPGNGRAYVCRAASNVVYRYAGGARRPIVRDWVVVDWRNVRMVPVRFRRSDGMITQPMLREMLGVTTVRRLRDRGHRFGLRGPLRGVWHESWRYGSVLTVFMDGRELAELVDWNSDGWVDQVLMRDVRFR